MVPRLAPLRAFAVLAAGLASALSASIAIAWSLSAWDPPRCTMMSRSEAPQQPLCGLLQKKRSPLVGCSKCVRSFWSQTGDGAVACIPPPLTLCPRGVTESEKHSSRL